MECRMGFYIFFTSPNPEQGFGVVQVIRACSLEMRKLDNPYTYFYQMHENRMIQLL